MNKRIRKKIQKRNTITIKGSELLNLGIQYMNSYGSLIPFKKLIPQIKANYKLWLEGKLNSEGQRLSKSMYKLVFWQNMCGIRDWIRMYRILFIKEDLLSRHRIIISMKG